MDQANPPARLTVPPARVGPLQEYWLKRWNLKQRYVCQLIHSAEVADDLAIDGAIAPSILKESVIRPLGPIPRQDRAEVFENAQVRSP